MALNSGDDPAKAVVDAILSAFDETQLSALLRYRGGMILEHEVDTGAPFRKVAQDLVTLLDQNDDVDPFVLLALAEKPRNPKLLAVAAGRGLQLPGTAPPPAVTGTLADFIAAARSTLPQDSALDAIAGQLGVGNVAADPNLQAFVAPRSRRIDFSRFEQRLAEMKRRTCLIRLPATLGTGFLVGPDRVLTNYHVVEKLITGQVRPDQLVCEFDFNTDAVASERVALSNPPTRFSRYAASDLSGSGEPDVGELDFALLSLARAVGDDVRGFYPLDAVPRLVARDDFLFVGQHARGEMLTLAMGTVTEFPGKALRIRYDVTTDHGSSGSPCFDAELNLIGLHHAAEPSARPRYNQGVPIWLVARHLAATA